MTPYTNQAEVEHDCFDFLDVEDAVSDYNDPGDYNGHGQHEYKVYVCQLCGDTFDYEPDVDDEE